MIHLTIKLVVWKILISWKISSSAVKVICVNTFRKIKIFDLDGLHTHIYCDLPGSPCLSKNWSNVRSVSLFLIFFQVIILVKCTVCFSFFNFFLGNYCQASHVQMFKSTCERTKGSLTPCLVAARSPGWFVGDPTSLARDNINQ